MIKATKLDILNCSRLKVIVVVIIIAPSLFVIKGNFPEIKVAKRFANVRHTPNKIYPSFRLGPEPVNSRFIDVEISVGAKESTVRGSLQTQTKPGLSFA